MKVGVLFLILAFTPATLASGFQIGVGGFTPHYAIGPGVHDYCNQIGESDVIYNRIYYVRVEGQRDALTYMVGYDSICSPIQGAFYTYKVYEGKWFGFGLTAGGYRFNMPNWIYEENHVPANEYKVTPVYTKVGNEYFVPVLAAEFNFALVHADTWSIWFNALVTPIISNLSLSLKKTF